MQGNPFQYLLPVRPEDFVGRKPLLRRIAFDLSQQGGDSHAIIAGRRCGKSSLLMALAHQLRQLPITKIGDYRPFPIYFDFKSATFTSVGTFFAFILNEVNSRVDKSSFFRPRDAWSDSIVLDNSRFLELANAKELTSREFEAALGHILNKLDKPLSPVRLILHLDEIDETLNHPWTQELFNQLRALVCSGDLKDQVRLVVAGSQRFQEEVSDRGSPLWNILKLNYLTAFDETGMRELLIRTKGIGKEIAAAVLQQSGGHPFLAQYLLYHLWEGNIHKANVTTVHNLASNFRREEFYHIEGWARALGVNGLQVYKVLATILDWVGEQEVFLIVNDQAANIKRALVALCYHGLAVHDDGWHHYKGTSKLFQDWFEEEGADFLDLLKREKEEGVKNFAELRRLIGTYFDEGELKTICSDLGIDYQSLPDVGKKNKVRELIEKCHRMGRINDLIKYCQQERPKVTWPGGKSLDDELII